MSAGLFIIYYNSGRFNNTYSDLRNEIDRANNSLNRSYEKTTRLDSGNWYLNKWEMYHTLSFGSDSTLMIDNHVDTLFLYKYALSKDTLWLMVKGVAAIPNKIKLHSNEELIFENFLDEKKELRYTRTNRLQK